VSNQSEVCGGHWRWCKCYFGYFTFSPNCK